MRRRSPVQTRKGAEEFERTLLREFGDDLASGHDPLSGPPPTFAAFTDDWFRRYVLPRNRLSSQLEKRASLKNHLVPAFGALRLDEITEQRIDAFVAIKREQGLAPKSVNNVLTILRCALATAQVWGLLRKVPRVHWLKTSRPPYKYLNDDEALRLITATPPGYWRALIVFLLRTGARFGEAAALRWDDLVLEGDAPFVRICRAAAHGIIGETKTARIRCVPLAPDAVAELDALPRRSEYVFVRPSGRIPQPQHQDYALHGFCETAGIKRVGWHTLRHTFATSLSAKGAPLRAVQELLGHSTINMTCRYAHPTPAMLRDAVALLTPNVHQVSTKRPRGPGEPDAQP